MNEFAVYCPGSSFSAAGQIDCTGVRSVSGQFSIKDTSEAVNVGAVLRPSGSQSLMELDALRCLDLGVGVSCAMLTELFVQSPCTLPDTLCEINCIGVLAVTPQLFLKQRSEMINVHAAQ